MPSNRTTDAAQAPYLTHVVSHHSQITLVPPDCNGRVRQTPTKGNKPRPRQERNNRTEEEVRFNVGPRSLRNLNGNRVGRRRQDNEESYPNYPPPSFLEATSVPASTGNATFVTESQPASPLAPDVHAFEPLPVSPPAHIPTSLLPLEFQPETDADSDTSLEIIEMNQLPAQEQLPSGSQLEANIKRDWIHRRGVEFPLPSESQLRDSSKGRGRAILDLDTEDTTEDVHSSRPSTPKHRALSPLRTLFPYRSMAVDQPFSASPNPSPYSSHHPSPFSSATSLKMSMSTTSITSVKGDGFISRKLLSFKGKERAKESLDTWEVVESHPDGCLSSEHRSSPTRCQSFTYGMPVAPNHTKPEAIPAPKSTPASTNVIPPHPLSLRDRKPPPVPHVTRPKRKAPPPPPKPAQVVPIPQGPILTSVRTRKPPPPPPPQKPGHLISSPLGHDSWRPPSLDVDAEPYSILQRAMATPLPLSPIDGLVENAFLRPSTPALQSPAASISIWAREPAPIVPSLAFPVLEGCSHATSGSQHMPGGYPCNDELRLQAPISVQPPSPASTSADGLLSSPRRHYPGRPLPQPPTPTPTSGATRSLVNSTYGTPTRDGHCVIQTSSFSFNSSQRPCQEGLLIDLDDSSLVYSNPPTPRIDVDVDGRVSGGYTRLVTPSYATASSSSSSVDLLGSIADVQMPATVIPRRPSPSPSSPPSPSPNRSEFASNTLNNNNQGTPTSYPFPSSSSSPSPYPYSEITDLDVLISRISENEPQDGSNYDALLLLSEFIGPASPPRRGTSTSTNIGLAPTPTQARPNSIMPEHEPGPHATPTPNVPLRGRVRVERRRITKDGRVKLKLGLLDAVVDKCGICLAQFRSEDAAQLGSVCRHAFHERCLERWLVRSPSRTCPLCRVAFWVDLGMGMESAVGRND